MREAWALIMAALVACNGGSPPGDGGSPDGEAPDSAMPADLSQPPVDSVGQRTMIRITNNGTDTAYLEGGYRSWCKTILGLYHVKGATKERIHLPTVAYCRCENCSATACAGMVSWVHHWISLPAGATISFDWDGQQRVETPNICPSVACWQQQPAEAGQYEVQVDYSRDRPVCPTGESSLPEPYITPPGVTLPAGASAQPCNPGDSTFCFAWDRSATVPFTLGAATVEVSLD
jgi:hypothetical protein